METGYAQQHGINETQSRTHTSASAGRARTHVHIERCARTRAQGLVHILQKTHACRGAGGHTHACRASRTRSQTELHSYPAPHTRASGADAGVGGIAFARAHASVGRVAAQMRARAQARAQAREQAREQGREQGRGCGRRSICTRTRSRVRVWRVNTPTCTYACTHRQILILTHLDKKSDDARQEATS
eukprot:1319562-Pleurochrysis_carterae.AAC.1